MAEVEMTPERQDIIARMEELRVRENEARRFLAHVIVDRQHVQLDCKHPARRNYTVMGDPTSSCSDCQHNFY